MSTSSSDWKPFPVCPADDCEETEDVTIMECAPGRTYMTIGGVCGHAVWLYRKSDAPASDALTELFKEDADG